MFLCSCVLVQVGLSERFAYMVNCVVGAGFTNQSVEPRDMPLNPPPPWDADATEIDITHGGGFN